VDLEFAVDAAEVVVDGVIAELEPVGDFLFDEALDHEFEDLAFAA
jgi:hypothetical protein